MLTQLKKTPVAAALAFIAACSVCLLPALIAAVAAGSLVSGAGGIAGNVWMIAAGVVVTAGSLGAVWLMRRRRDGCAPSAVDA